MITLLEKMFQDRLESQEVGKFMSFPGEKFIFATREHYVPLFFRIIEQAFMTLAASLLLAGASYFVFREVRIASAVYFLTFLVGSGFSIKEIIHWYFHVYIITTKKLLEVRYSPLFSEAISSVLLDQVRCTEIDADLTGIISEHLNLGNVSITFDRPTHQDYFILKNIRAPRMIADLLSTQLHKNTSSAIENLWVRGSNGNRFTYLGGVPYGTTISN